MSLKDSIYNEIENLKNMSIDAAVSDLYYNKAFLEAQKSNPNTRITSGHVLIGIVILIENVTINYFNKAIETGQTVLQTLNIPEYYHSEMQQIAINLNNYIDPNSGPGGSLGTKLGRFVNAISGNNDLKPPKHIWEKFVVEMVTKYFELLYRVNCEYIDNNSTSQINHNVGTYENVLNNYQAPNVNKDTIINSNNVNSDKVSTSKKESTSDKIRKDEKRFPSFDDVVGLEMAKKAIFEKVIKPSKYPEIYKKYGIKVGGGILLYGLPGTGKTMFAQAVANEIEGGFYSITASDLKSKWYGETEQKIKELFDEAKNNKISVIFIDEFEAIGMSRNKENNDLTTTTVVPELLAQMQGFQQNENILVVIAATNRPWDIDPALLRPGRFDTKVYVELPNNDCRKLMITNYLKQIKLKDFCVEYLVENTDEYNGADIKNVCDELIKIAINHEIAGDLNYEINVDDCVTVLKYCKSSVTEIDKELTYKFIQQN